MLGSFGEGFVGCSFLKFWGTVALLVGTRIEQNEPFENAYAHIEIVVAFLVVNLFVFLVITRHHGSFERRH